MPHETGDKMRCKARHSVVVAVIGPIEVRIGETKWPCTAYSKDGKAFARTNKEFDAKFEPAPEAMQ